MALGSAAGAVAAACALRRKRPSLPFHLVAVEAEPTNFEWLKKHFRDNGIDPLEHTLISRPVAGRTGTVSFTIGKPASWYGQAIVHDGFIDAVTMEAITLVDLLSPLKHVDLIDMDIQGAEFEVLAAARTELDRKVKRCFIGTHGTAIEQGLRRLFRSLGWRKVWDFAFNGERRTPYGKVNFQDGVQCWCNARLV